MTQSELTSFLQDVIKAEEIERARMVAALERDPRASVDAIKALQNILCSLSDRARKELGMPSLRKQREGSDD
jgi:hypothetical protein